MLVLAGAVPGGSLGAKPGGGSTGGACALVPHLHELSIGQGLPYPVLVRGKEILARAYLSRPQCSDNDDIIDITSASLTMTGGGATAAVGPTPTITTTFPQLAPFTSAPAQDAAGDPKFVIPATATTTATTLDRYTASFSLRVDYRSRTTSSATPVSSSVTFPLPNQVAPTATIEKKTAALRILVQPLGDPTQAYSTWFTDADRITMQNAMTTLSRIFPVPNGTGDLTGSTGGVRYTINPSVLDIRSLLGSDGKWCGTESNWSAIKATLAQHLQSWNTANPGATADVVVGAVSSTKSSGGSAGCAEAMSIPGSPQMWVRSLPDANRAPSISGSLLVMEMAHYLRVVPETRDAFGDAFHSPYTAADGTNPNRGYNVFQRSYLADDRSVMLLTGTGWHNNTTLLERDDFAAILCQLGGATTNDCGVAGTVGTTTGVAAGPRFVMSGRTDGTLAGTHVVESYFTSDVAPTQPDPGSAYRLLQYQGTSLLRDDGVPVIFAESEHGQADDSSPAGLGIFAVSLPASTAANRVQLVKDGVVLYERTGTVPPQIVTTTRLQSGEIVNYTDDDTRDDTGPALTNDGKWVAWEAPVGDFIYVHVAPASDVGQAVQLGPPGDPIASEDPAWCGDGTKLAYVAGDDIYTIGVGTRGPGIDFGTPFLVYDADEIEPGGLPAGTHPTWSPDCSQLAFEASSDIWKINADGTGRIALTTDDRSHDPSWSQTSGDDRIAYQREAFFFEIGMVEDIVLASHPGTESEFIVTTTADEDDPEQQCLGEADCSLREAIKAANATVAKDSIHFALTGTAPFTITPATQLPDITSPLIIDGTTQAGWTADNLAMELDGSGTIGAGLRVTAGSSEIRGLAIGRFGQGIVLFAPGGNVIQGNFIGTDATGTVDRGNEVTGIVTFGGGTVIGGPAATDRNVISGTNDGHGIALAAPAGDPTNVVQNNHVGTDRTGTVAIPNATGGVRIQSGVNQIGGVAADTGNLISGNGTGVADSGIAVTGGTNTIQGNYIGTNGAGTGAIDNNRGINLQGGTNIVGGSSAGSGNLISGNDGDGMRVVSGVNTVQGNLIGTDATGAADLGNTGFGIQYQGTTTAQIGGTAAAARNVISGNDSGGIGTAEGASGMVVQGNWIGLGTDDSAIPNLDGIQINRSSNNTIGGSAAGAGNRIAHNTQDGVVVNEAATAADGNLIVSNAIFSNGQLGIDLGNNGPTANDAGDVDPGANNLQNFPVVTTIGYPGEGTDVSGTLNSAPDTVYTIEAFSSADCDGSGFGEGETSLGRATTTTDGSGNASWSLSTPTLVGAGDVVTATATAPDGSTSEFSACAAPVAEAPSFVVNTTDDAVDAFGCGTFHCSLREAINRANSVAGTDTISFAIPGAGPHTIQPATELPAVSQPAVIDATTEPDYTATPVVELNGAGAPASSVGLRITGGDTTVRGLAINRFGTSGSAVTGGAGILLSGAGNNLIEGNFLGTDVTGTLDRGNREWGIAISLSSNNVIGGTSPEARNVISGNGGTGVGISGASGVATGNRIIGNYIGTDLTGTIGIGNTFYGVDISQAAGNLVGGPLAGEGNVISGNGTAGVGMSGTGSVNNVVSGNLIGTDESGASSIPNFRGIFLRSGPFNNTIGGTTAGAGNVIAHSVETGILLASDVSGTSTQIDILGNSIHSTFSGLGIDLAPAGVNANDANDSDSGSNRLQNYPVISAATTTGTDTTIAGTLDSEATRTFRLEFFSNPDCNASGNGEGQTLLGSTSVTTNASGDATFSHTLPVPTAVGDAVTTTATETAFGNTSEFSVCEEVAAAPVESPSWVVNTTDDDVDAFGCGTLHCSLREAILRANGELNGDGPDEISFDIPGLATPADPHIITVESALPAIVESVVIDASTEPDFSTATDAPVVQLDGTGVSAEPTDGLVLRTGSSTIRGLSITNFRDAGVRIESNGNTLEGNYIGIEPDGVTAAPNGWGEPGGYGVRIENASSNRIGRADGIETPETNRNIISGNDGVGVIINGAAAMNNSIENNYIGTNASGTAAMPNIVSGVVVADGTQNSIGGITPGTGNVISGNAGDGVTIIGDSGSGGTNFVQQNRIGTNADGTAAIPNDGPLPTDGRGILIVNATDNTIGGLDGVTGASVGNLISGNATDGVEIQGNLSAGNDLTANQIGTNAAGTAAIPNGGSGIEILAGAGAQIGSSLSGTGNVISGNAGDGVAVVDGLVNRIVGNAIDENGGLGINLVAVDDTGSGVTENDANDADNGPNALLNFPVIESASYDGTTATISGFLESVPPGDYNLHFYSSAVCDASDHGEGGRFLGGVPISSDADGDVPFTFTTTSASQGDEITATATDEDLNTSEFSACATVAGEADLSVEIMNDDPDPVTAGEALTYGISMGNAGPADATNVVVTLVLSEDVDFDPDANSPNCSESAGTVTCESETLASDGGGVFAVVVIPRRSGLLVGDISIAADEQDPNLENNTDSEQTTVLGAAWEIWTVDPAAPVGSHALLVNNGTQPSWGTNDQIAFARDSGIWLVAGDGEGAAHVADTGSSDRAPALGGRILGFQRTIPFDIEGSHEDVMLVREAEVIDITATVAQPDNARFDIFFDCGGPFFPMAVGLPPDAVTDDGMAKLAYTYDSSLSCGSGTPTITAVVSDGVFRSDAGAEDAKTGVNAEPKPPVVAIYSPVDGEPLLQFDVIPAHGWGKDPEDGQLGEQIEDDELSWTLSGPGGVVLGTGTGHAKDFQPPAAGWTPSAIVGGVPVDDYAITLTGTDSAGNTSSRTHTFAILADADRDNLHAGIDRTSCPGTAGSGENNAANAFTDLDGDGIPNSDDRFTSGGVCTAEDDFSALANFDPDEFNIPATGVVATVSIRVPYRVMSQVDGNSVKITEIGGIPVNVTQVPRGWSVKDGVGVAKFDRIALAEFFEDHGMVGQRVTIVVEGSSKAGVSPQWSFEGIDSTMVKFGS